MIIRSLTGALIVILAVSCSGTAEFIAEGTVNDPAFEGSKIYLVSLDGPVSKNVDSTIIREGKFLFRKKADSLGVKILRVPARFPVMVEDLVVVTEPGTVHAVLSENSFGGGTRLNDVLQVWKERKHVHDSIQAELYSRKKNATRQAASDSIMTYSGILAKKYYDNTREMMNENITNGIGLLLFKVYYHSLTAIEKKEILSRTGDLYTSHDAQLKLMISNDETLRGQL